MLQSIIDFLYSISFYDYITILFFALFGFFGYIRGAAKIGIHGLWLIIGLAIAYIFHQYLTLLGIFDFLFSDEKLLLLANFILILVLFYLFKSFVYRALNFIANMHGPCPFNRFLAFFVGYGLVVLLSWYIAFDIQDNPILIDLFGNHVVRFAISFTTLLFLLLLIGFILIKLLNVKVGIDRPCPLIKALQPLDDILNAKNINSFANSFGGILLGIIQGFLLLIIIFLSIGQTSNSQIELWFVEDKIIGFILDLSLKLQDVLSKYLLFIDG